MAPDTTTTPAPAAAPPPADQRAGLAALRARGERYAFLDHAWRYLASTPDDPAMVVEVFKALVELGLGGPARELLRGRRDLTGPQAAALRDSIRNLPAGRVPWGSLAGTFEANLAALREGHPYLRDVWPTLEAALRRALDGFQLHRSCDGRLHLSRREGDGPSGARRVWHPAITDHAPIEGARPSSERLQGPLLVVGLHFNDFVDHVHAASSTPAGQPAWPLYLIEPALARAAAWLHVADRRAILGDPRVHAFVGPGAAADYEAFLAETPDVEPPATRLACFVGDAACRRFDEAGARAMRRRDEKCAAALAHLEERRRPRRLGPGSRIIGFTTRFSTMVRYSMRDIGRALEDLGHEFRLQIESADHRTMSKLVVADAIDRFDPDLIILINHFRHEMPELMAGVPVLTWIQDPTEVVMSRATGPALGPLDFVCGYYRGRCTGEFGYPPERFFPAPLPVSTRVFHDSPLPPGEEARWSCDLMYAGHLHHTVAEHMAVHRDAVPASARPLLDRLAADIGELHERGVHLRFADTGAVVDEAAAGTGVSLTPEVRERLAGFFAYRLYDMLFRRETLRWAAGWARRTGRSFRLYGTGWERDEQLAPFAAGPLEHGESLRRAFRGARLAIQTLPGGFKHQRTFEALLSGALVLGRRVPTDMEPAGASRWFGDLDAVVFRDGDELAERAECYLSDDGRRAETRAAFAGVVRESFTYERVVGGVLEQVRRQMRASAG